MAEVVWYAILVRRTVAVLWAAVLRDKERAEDAAWRLHAHASDRPRI
jgi:hypothetical protein